MGTTVAAGPISMEEYLSNPEYEHCEYVDGQVIPLNVGKKKHGRIQANCTSLLHDYFKRNPRGYVATELHCRLQIAGGIRFRLPDVSAVLQDDSPDSDYLERSPDFVIEIRSQEDTIASQIRKMADYFANGARLAWLILPEDRSVLVFEAADRMRPVLAGETLDGGGVLPDLRVSVEDLLR